MMGRSLTRAINYFPKKSRKDRGILVKCVLRESLYEHKLVECYLDIIDGFSLVSIGKIYVYKHRF